MEEAKTFDTMGQLSTDCPNGCRKCGQPGHFARDCKKAFGSNSEMIKISKKEGSTDTETKLSDTDDDDDSSYRVLNNNASQGAMIAAHEAIKVSQSSNDMTSSTNKSMRLLRDLSAIGKNITTRCIKEAFNRTKKTLRELRFDAHTFPDARFRMVSHILKRGIAFIGYLSPPPLLR